MPTIGKLTMIRCALCFLTFACICPIFSEDSDRKATWATLLKLEGVENFFRVSDRLYRSAQPTDSGMKKLKDVGVVTVINLRAFHNDRKSTAEAGLLNEELSVNTWHCEDEMSFGS